MSRQSPLVWFRCVIACFMIRPVPSRGFRLLAISLIAATICTVASADDPTAADQRHVTLQLTDDTGAPVAGAEVGLSALVGPAAERTRAAEHATTTADPEKTGTPQWWYDHHVRSTAEGRAVLAVPAGLLNRFAVVARHETRRLIAIASIGGERDEQPQTLVLTPERTVQMRVSSSDLARRGLELGEVRYDVYQAGRLAITLDAPAPTAELVLPSGEYEVQIGNLTTTHPRWRKLAVTREPALQDAVAVDLPATRQVMLIGQPAPELPEVSAWVNGTNLKLADLRGRCVLLDFWGYWCGPCVQGMPNLLALHDHYAPRGLTIVGVHADLGEEEEQPVDSVARFAERIAPLRAQFWPTRDVPFPIALVSGRKVPFGAGLEGDALGAAFAAYGVRTVPCLILIDRQGNVAGRFFPERAESIALLERLLATDSAR